MMNSLTKKLAAGVIAAATMFSIAGLGATTANAANASDGSIEVSSSNAEFKGKTVTAYQMLFPGIPDCPARNCSPVSTNCKKATRSHSTCSTKPTRTGLTKFP